MKNLISNLAKTGAAVLLFGLAIACSNGGSSNNQQSPAPTVLSNTPVDQTTNVDVQPLDRECAFPEAALAQYHTLLGPLAQILRASDEPARSQIADAVHTAFQQYVHGAEVRFTAACWSVTARSPQ